MLVSNLTSPRSGNPVANQFEISDGERVYFQSYSTLIAYKFGASIVIGSAHNYSRTTSKYFYQWLRDNAYGLRYECANISKWLKKAEYGDTHEFGPYVLQYVRDIQEVA